MRYFSIFLAPLLVAICEAGSPTGLPEGMFQTSSGTSPNGDVLVAGVFPGLTADQFRVELWKFELEVWTELSLLPENGGGSNALIRWDQGEEAFLMLQARSDMALVRRIDPVLGEVQTPGWPREILAFHQNGAVYQPEGGDVYLLGGEDPWQCYSNCSVFHMDTLQWVALTPLPEPRAYGAGYVDSLDRIWCGGGRGEPGGYSLGEVWMMSPGRGVWEEQNPITSRELFAFWEYSGEMFATGGYCADPIPGNPPPPQGSWSFIANTQVVGTGEFLEAVLEEPRGAHSALVDISLDCVFIFGGERLYELEGRAGPCQTVEILALPNLKSRWFPPKGMSTLAIEEMARERSQGKRSGWQTAFFWQDPVSAVSPELVGREVRLSGGSDLNGEAVENVQTWNRDDPLVPTTGALGLVIALLLMGWFLLSIKSMDELA